MIKVTPPATTILKKQLQEKQASTAVRIDVISLGSSWKSLALRLDSPKDTDVIYQHDDIVFLVESGLLKACGKINIDYISPDPTPGNLTQGGFSISSQTPLAIAFQSTQE